jgi:hypothetical protein
LLLQAKTMDNFNIFSIIFLEWFKSSTLSNLALDLYKTNLRKVHLTPTSINRFKKPIFFEEAS